MKWIVMLYLFFIIVVSSFSKLFSEKEYWKYENLFPYFFVFYFFFLSIFCLIGYKNYQNEQILVEQNEILIYKKMGKEYVLKQIKQKEKSLENTVTELQNKADTLNKNKSDLLKEIKKLQNIYYDLYNRVVKETSYEVKNFPTFDQKENYPNGCESIALYLLLKYHGVKVTPDAIITKLKKGDSPYTVNGVRYGADPEIEFVGNPKSHNGYGVFENPIIDVANQFKKGIVKATGKSLDEILEIVKRGKPVQVWASSYQKEPIKCDAWTSTSNSSKRRVVWYCNFHSLVLIGATPSEVIVSDPLTGTIVHYDKEKFAYAYNFYGRRAIYYE